jgi:hypothetical protein
LGSSPVAARIANPSISEAWGRGTVLKEPSDGYFSPTGAFYAGTTFA